MPKIIDVTPAPESLFWYWIAERHSIYLKRQRGEPKPWTDDPILRDYKFTNVFRELDKGTVWLRENFLEPHRDDDPALIAFNICWYRMFNFIPTGERLGWQTYWNAPRVKEFLREIHDDGIQVFTGAHLVRSRKGMHKIDSTVDVCTDLWNLRHTFVKACRHNSLQEVFETFESVAYVRCGFLAYEMVTDFRHTKLLENATDINTWAHAGAGATRGLRRLELPWKTKEEAVRSMRIILGLSRVRLPLSIPAFELRDVEHSLCEFDKYVRVMYKEGIPRSKYPGAA